MHRIILTDVTIPNRVSNVTGLILPVPEIFAASCSYGREDEGGLSVLLLAIIPNLKRFHMI